MTETCLACQKEYSYDRTTCTMNLYIENPECNHIATKCTHCGGPERIYAGPDHFLGVMHALEAGVSLHARAEPWLIEAAQACWSAQKDKGAPDELPELPKQFLRELYDDLRNWRGEEI